MKYLPPWKEPYFIGVAGCSGSGKTSVVSMIIQKLNMPWTMILSMDNFYKVLTPEQKKLAFESNYDFDSPESIDFDLMLEVLKSIKAGHRTEVPIYSFCSHSRTNEHLTVYGANVVIIEGIYALYDPRVLDMLDLKIFVQEDYDVCMARRLHRDILYRNRQLDLSIQQWHRFVKPNYLLKVLPTQKAADILIPKGIENHVAIEMLITHIRRRLQEMSAHHLADLQKLGQSCTDPVDKLVYLPEHSAQLQAIHTLILNRQTNRDNFVFYFNRMADLLITVALEAAFESNVDEMTVLTPAGATFNGVHLPFDRVCAVTMVRGGECFEVALKASIPTIPLGRLLIQSDATTGEPKLHTRQLPPCIDSGRADYKVLLTDAQVLSGAAAVMGIAVLVDHGIPQENIIFITYSASEIGIRRLHAAFPHIKIVVGRVSPTILSMDLDVRYYGT